MTTPVVTGDDLDRIAVLMGHFDIRRPGSCPYCHCVTAWINHYEFGDHVFRCIQIEQGLDNIARTA